MSSVQEVFKLYFSVMAYTASMATYKEFRKAQEEYQEAQKERILIEKACAESFTMIRQYREEMDRVVSKFGPKFIYMTVLASRKTRDGPFVSVPMFPY